MKGRVRSSGIGGGSISRGARHIKYYRAGPAGFLISLFLPAMWNLRLGTYSIRYGAAGGTNSARTLVAPIPRCNRRFLHDYRTRERRKMMILRRHEATITPVGVGGFASMKGSRKKTTIRRAPAARDAGRDGLVLAEGGVDMILE